MQKLLLILAFAIFTCGSACDALAQGSWAEDSTNGFLPVGGAGSCVIDGEIYVLGGSAAPNFSEFSTGMQIFDPLSHSWTQGPQMPTARYLFSCNSMNGKIYAFGGTPGIDSNVLKTIDIFDTSSNAWIEGPQIPIALSAQTSCVVNGKIYLFGGFWNSSTLPLSTVFVYNPSDSSWSDAPPMPTARAYLSSSVLNGKIYLVGGFNDSLQFLPTVEIFNPDSNTWSSGPPMPIGQYGCASTVFNGMLYVIGSTEGYPTSIVEIFDPAFNSWTLGPEMPTEQTYPAVQAVDGKVFAIGGIGIEDAVDLNAVLTVGASRVLANTATSSSIIQVFPNPATNALQIMGIQPGTIHLFDPLGREQMNAYTNSSSVTLDVSHLQAGMYFLRLGTQSAKIEIAH